MPPPLGIVRLASEFWRQSGRASQPPYNVELACERVLPLPIISIPNLTHQSIYRYLNSIYIEIPMPRVNRKLHGGIVATRGRGFVFVDELDSPEERAFTIAHEIGHFLADYIVPRNRAQERLGPDILEVLDGLRQPMLDERAHAVLSGVSLPVYRHSSERNRFWGCRFLTGSSEANADQVALELLAPDAEVLGLVKIDSRREFNEIASDFNRVLRETFSLPKPIADLHSHRMAMSRTGGPSVREWLGLI